MLVVTSFDFIDGRSRSSRRRWASKSMNGPSGVIVTDVDGSHCGHGGSHRAH